MNSASLAKLKRYAFWITYVILYIHLDFKYLHPRTLDDVLLPFAFFFSFIGYIIDGIITGRFDHDRS
jgi:hypothetical protein